MTSVARWVFSVPASWGIGVLVMVVVGASGVAGDRIPLSEGWAFAIFTGFLHGFACVFLYVPVILLLQWKGVSSRLWVGAVMAVVGLLPLLALAALWGSVANAATPEGILFGSCFIPAAAAFGALNARR